MSESGSTLYAFKDIIDQAYAKGRKDAIDEILNLLRQNESPYPDESDIADWLEGKLGIKK